MPLRCIVFLAALALAVLPGCNKPEASAQQQATGSAEEPAAPAKKDNELVPDLPKDTDVAPVPIQALAEAYESADAAQYEQDAKTPIGRLYGACLLAEGATPPADSKPIDISKPGMIQDPKPKEIEFYKQFEMKTPQWVNKQREGGQVVVHAAIVVHGVTKGRRDYLDRPVLSSWCGMLNPPRQNVAFVVASVNDRVQFLNADPFPVHFVVKGVAGGETYLDETVPACEAKTPDNAEPIDAWIKHNIPGGSWWMGQWINLCPKTRSKPIRGEGVYKATNTRYTWQENYLLMVRNPYVAVSKHDGKFEIPDLPAGDYKVTVWHPCLKATQEEYAISVKENETTALKVELK